MAECGQYLPLELVPFDGTSGDAAAEAFVAWGGLVRARFAFRETVRPEAETSVALLRRLQFDCVMLTGDREPRAKALAEPLGLACHANLLPDAKLALIRLLRSAGPVVMVGDGINDAPALAAADVGIALGSGADISRHSAHVCLLTSDLARLPWLIGLARQTQRTIRWNLIWAFSYNIAGIGLAATGYLHPVVAAIAMGLSSLLVVTNSLSLARRDGDAPVEEAES
jgi:P-type E1-E2 ATPase